MNEFLENSLFAGVTISLLAYMAGAFLKKKFKIALLNPLLISIILSIVVLVTAVIDYDVYKLNGNLNYLDGGKVCDVSKMPLTDKGFWILVRKKFEEHIK